MDVEFLQDRDTRIFAGVAGVLVLVIALSWWLGGGDGDSDANDRATDGARIHPPVQAPYTLEPEDVEDTDGDGDVDADDALAAAGAGWAGQGELPPGIPGEGLNANAPSFPLRITATSSHSIAALGYQVPTSPDERHHYRAVDNPGSSFSVTTTVYGNPDYGWVFVQAGQVGSVTCTITVDGKVTERRTTEGPHGVAICQG